MLPVVWKDMAARARGECESRARRERRAGIGDDGWRCWKDGGSPECGPMGEDLVEGEVSGELELARSIALSSSPFELGRADVRFVSEL